MVGVSMRNLKQIFSVGLCMSVFSFCGVHAQVNFDGTKYTQNFDSLGTADAKWKNNSTIPGWYAVTAKPRVPNLLKLQTDAAQAGFMNLGAAEDTDRSFGGSVQYFSVFYGVQIVNKTDKTFTELNMGYTGEQWSDCNKPGQAVMVYYKINDTGFNIKTEDNGYKIVPGYTKISELQFEHPKGTAAGILLNGHDASNKAALTTSITGVTWAPGDSIWIYWFDRNNGGKDQAFGINDFSFTASTSASK